MNRIRLARSGSAVGAVAVVLVAAGCGASHGANGAAHANTHANTVGSKSQATTTASRSTSIGKVMTTASGRTIYELVGDPASNSKCTGGCLSIWPAVMTNGKQLVVKGHPAFTFAGDSAAGQAKGQGLTDQWGTWLALSPSGSPIHASSSGSSGGGSGGSGGGWG